jgi:hypothetical protein
MPMSRDARIEPGSTHGGRSPAAVAINRCGGANGKELFFVSRDGQRFIVVTVLDVTQSPPINVVTDWQSQLPR